MSVKITMVIVNRSAAIHQGLITAHVILDIHSLLMVQHAMVG